MERSRVDGDDSAAAAVDDNDDDDDGRNHRCRRRRRPDRECCYPVLSRFLRLRAARRGGLFSGLLLLLVVFSCP